MFRNDQGYSLSRRYFISYQHKFELFLTDFSLNFRFKR